MIRRMYVLNFMYLIIPLIVITLAIYLITSGIYYEILHERNLLQLSYFTEFVERNEIEFWNKCNLTDGYVFISDRFKNIIRGMGLGFNEIFLESILNEIDLSHFKQGSKLKGYYIYSSFIPAKDFYLFYLRPKKSVDSFFNHYKYTLLLVFIGLLFLFMFLLKKTTAKLTEPIESLYKMVWDLMDVNSRLNSQKLGEDEIEIVKNYLSRLQNTLKERDFKLKRNLFGIMDVLVDLLEIKDSYTASHSRQVRKYSIAIAQMMDLDEQQIRDIAFAATLHDIGKIGVSQTILNKQGKLTTTEYSMIKKHPVVADEVLKNIEELDSIRKIIRHHHEKYDGTGYPDGLKGKEIPLAARIVSVADAFDAMTSDRPYRKALSYDEATAIINEEKGRQFDPAVVDALITYLEQQNIQVRRPTGT